jgi:CRP-like cAMP-binding protein
VPLAKQRVNLGALFARLGQAKRFRRHQTIFAQGDGGDSLFYIQSGVVRLASVPQPGKGKGKEAVIGILARGECFGEGCLSAQHSVRTHTAVALSDLRLLQVGRDSLLDAIHAKPDVGYAFIAYLLARSAQIQADLANNLLDMSERRLARVLLSPPENDGTGRVSKISQQTLAEMIGVSRQRVNFLMKRFRRLRLIDDQHGLKVRSSLKRLARTG